MKSTPVKASLKCRALPEETREALLTCETLGLVPTETVRALPLSSTKPNVLTSPSGVGAELTISFVFFSSEALLNSELPAWATRALFMNTHRQSIHGSE